MVIAHTRTLTTSMATNTKGDSMKKDLCNPIAAFAGAVLLGAVFSSTAWAETREITVNGSTDSCHSREIASKLARTDAVNTANKECRDIGTGWSYTGNVIWGYEQCFRCGNSEEFKCKVFNA
jgi:hypothetical protein